jgi:hypothetical protein
MDIKFRLEECRQDKKICDFGLMCGMQMLVLDGLAQKL